MADVAVLAELRGIDGDHLGAFADWTTTAILTEARERGLLHVTVHSGRRAVDFHLRNGFNQHRQLLLWEPAGP